MCLTSALTRLLKLTKNLRQKGICRIRVHPAASHFLFTACLRTESASEPNAQLTQLSSLETKPHTGQIHCRSESHAVVTEVVLLRLQTQLACFSPHYKPAGCYRSRAALPRLWLHWLPPPAWLPLISSPLQLPPANRFSCCSLFPAHTTEQITTHDHSYSEAWPF